MLIETPSSQPEMMPAISNQLEPKRVNNILNGRKHFAFHGNRTSYDADEPVVANMSRSAPCKRKHSDSSLFSNLNQLKSHSQKALQLRMLKHSSDTSLALEKTVKPFYSKR